MKVDIEKYLNGEMDDAERSRFEEKLRHDAALQEEVDQERYFLERLRGQMMREKIAEAVAGAVPPPKMLTQRFWWKTGLVAVGVALLLGGWFIFRQPSPELPPETQPSSPVSPKENPAVSESPAPPVAENKRPLPAPAAPASGNEGIRGENDPSGEAWYKLINAVWQLRFDWQPADFSERFAPVAAFIKEKDFTLAYVELQELERQSSQNDTLVFLKAHCLTEMREGKEALRYIERLSGTDHPWQQEAEWLEGLCYLLLGEKQRAVTVLKTIAATPGHPYRTEAQAALRKLK